MTERGQGGRLGRFGWAMFDWSNQPIFTLISTFIFAPYFAATVVGDPVEGQSLWGYAQSIAGLMIALLSPILGAIADQTGPRKPWIAAFQVICIVAAAALWFAVPNAPTSTLLITMLAVIALTIGAECSIVFNNAMLPTLVPNERMGRLSGNAWALGYLGGLVTLGIILAGFSFPERPLFGLDKATHEHARIVGPFTAVWIVLFVLPLFLFTPDVPRRTRDHDEAVRKGLAALLATLRELRHYRNIGIFLLGRMASYDGLNALFAFGGIYAASTFGWGTIQIGTFGLILAVAGTFGAWLGGKLDDKVGPKKVVMGSLLILLVALAVILLIDRDAILFVKVAPPVAGGKLFGAPAEQAYLCVGMLLGFAAGPLQAASRTLLIRLAPVDRITQHFGLFALTGKMTSFVGMLMVATVTALTMNQKAGMGVLIAFFIAGLVLLSRVRTR